MTKRQKKVETWFENLIDDARKEGEGHVGHGVDLTEPCQIEVFWMNNPLEGQVFIITHDRDRPDKEIIVNGPFEGPSFVQELEGITNAGRWQKPIPPPRNQKPGQGPPSRADVLANTISRFIDRLEQSIFSESFPTNIFFGGKRLWDNTFSHIYLGNVAEHNIEELFGETADSDTEEQDENEVTSDQENQVVENETTESNQERVPTGGGYIYDPVWIEKAPEYTFSEKVWGEEPFTYDKTHTSSVCGLDLHVYRDGLLLINSDDGQEIKDILNTLFAVGTVHRYRTWRILLDREIYSASMVDGEIKQSSSERSTPSGRNQLAQPQSRPSDYDRSLLTIEALERFIEIVEAIYPIHNVRNRMILHLQAHTHLLDDEFDASFVLNWTVIEQLIEDLLKDKVQDRGIDWEDKELEFAEITDLIDDSEYELLDKHRDLRNSIIHDMDSVSVREAEELDLLVSKLVVRNINQHLEEQEISPIEYRPTPIKFSNRKPEIQSELFNSILGIDHSNDFG